VAAARDASGKGPAGRDLRQSGVHHRSAGGQRARVVVEPRAGLRCTLSVQVTNTGSVGVGVEELRVRPHDGPPDSGAVTVYRVHGRVGAGQTRTFTMALVDNPEGCKVAGTLELDPWPAVRVHVWGRTREVGSSTALALRNVPNEPRGDGCT
jgi:hypothetical protein